MSRSHRALTTLLTWSTMSFLPVLLSLLTSASVDPLVFDDERPTTLLPLYAVTDADLRAQELVYERLFSQEALRSEPTSRLIARWALRGTDLVLTVDPRLRFADGHRVDAEDVCFSIDAVLEPANPVPWAGEHRRALVGCEVEGASTAVVRFARPVPDRRAWLDIALLPAHRFESTTVPEDHPLAREALGTRGMTATMEETGIVYRSTDRKRSIRALGLRWDLDLEDVRAGRAHGMPMASAELEPGENLLERRFDTGDTWFVLVQPRDVLASVTTRIALDRAIDRTALRAAIWGDGADDPSPVSAVVTAAVRPSSPYYDQTIAPRPQATLPPGTLERLRLGIGEAQEAAKPGLGRAIADQLVAQGVEVEIVELPGDPLTVGYDRARLQGLDLLLGRWVSRLPNHLRPLVHPEGSHNPFGVATPERMRLLEVLETAETDAAYVEAARALHRTAFEEVHAIWLVSGGERSVWTERLTRAPVTPLYYWSEIGSWRLAE